jgi:streptomycin 6-kinase
MNSAIQVPPSVVSGVRNRWPNIGSDWASNVLADLNDLCSRYRATPIRVLPARFGFVVSVETPSGRMVMRATPDPAGPAQAAVARELAGYGVAPQVHEVLTSDAGTWTIMDEVLPGTSLADVDESILGPDAVAEMFRAIVSRPAPDAANMQGIADWLRGRLTDPDTTDLPIGQLVASGQERRHALTLLDGLAATAGMGWLCHGDSYPGNVLVGSDGRLMWIDPRGVTGEVSYDVAVFALKASGHVASAARAMASRIAERAGTDLERARSWVIVASAARV